MRTRVPLRPANASAPVSARVLVLLALLALLLPWAPSSWGAAGGVHLSEPTPYGQAEAEARCAPGRSAGEICRVTLARRSATQERVEVVAGTGGGASAGSCASGRTCRDAWCDGSGCAYQDGDRVPLRWVNGTLGRDAATACVHGLSWQPWCVGTMHAAEEACLWTSTAWVRETKTCLYPFALLP